MGPSETRSGRERHPMVKGVKTLMVNGPLRWAAWRVSPSRPGRAKNEQNWPGVPAAGCEAMPLSKTPGLPTKTTAAMSDQALEAIASALRTLEAEASGVTALSAALQSDLGPAFVAASDLILKARGRLIITG